MQRKDILKVWFLLEEDHAGLVYLLIVINVSFVVKKQIQQTIRSRRYNSPNRYMTRQLRNLRWETIVSWQSLQKEI